MTVDVKRVDQPPSYGPCTWHCLEKRQRRFEAPQHPYRSRVTGHSNIPLPATGLKEPYPCYVTGTLELLSMHLTPPRETPEAFRGTPTPV